MFILLPVLVLAGFGLFSLRQDKLLVRSEAEERARELAKTLAEEVWNALTSMQATGLSTQIQFRMDPDSQLLFPVPYQDLPQPKPYPYESLDSHQQSLWLDLVGSESSEATGRSYPSLATAFLDTKPPASFAAAVHFRLGTWLALHGKSDEASAQFQIILSQHPNTAGETGLPLQPLASLKLLELNRTQRLPDNTETAPAIALEQTCSNAVHAPSTLTPLILEKAFMIAEGSNSNQVLRWQQEWARQESSRRLYQAFRAQWTNADLALPAYRLFVHAGETSSADFPILTWIAFYDAAAEGQETNWLVIRAGQSEQGTLYRGLPSAQITSMFEAQSQTGLVHAGGPTDGGKERANDAESGPERNHAVVDRLLDRLPAYALATVEVAGMAWTIHSMERGQAHAGNQTALRQSGSGTSASKANDVDVLATAVFPGKDARGVRVGVHLAQATLLYAQQRQRTWWFGLLIAGAAMTAAIGYLLAHRAFGKQQRLAAMKSNFVSSVSHELRAPIASVRLMAESLDRGTIQDPARQSEYYRFIVQECRRLSSMIENVLDFSRIEQGRKQYEFEPTDLRRLVEDSIKLMTPAATERGVNLRSELPKPEMPEGDVHPVLDGQAMQRALINLIDNAIKHSAAGGTVWVDGRIGPRKQDLPPASHETPNSPKHNLTIHLEQTRDGDTESARSARLEGWVTLSVRDQGPGIPPEDQEKIFERFYRRGSELRRETQGIGIGLSIVKHIVQAHGGTVRVESQLGQGSRFTIDLPMTIA